MSVDLDWLQLSALSDRLVDSLNRHLRSAERPSFLGPITINSFDFGTIAPDVELVDVRDIYRDFLEDEGASESDHNSSSEQSESAGREETDVRVAMRFNNSQEMRDQRRGSGNEEDGFEWVSRRGVGRAIAETGPGYHPFPPHVRYGGVSSASNILGPGTPFDLGRWQQTEEGDRPSNPRRGSSQQGSMTDGHIRMPSSPKDLPLIDSIMASAATPPYEMPLATPQLPPPKNQTPSDTENDLQFHFRLVYNADLRISLTTSLLLNYPSPLFMALPIKLAIVGFEFNGEVVVAYQPSRSRIHVCILDDEDPYRPASASSPTEDQATHRPYDKEKMTAGERLLPHIFIESEIGQTDKQVLRNVSRVERFIQDMMRATLEEELVFPNFHTVVYGADEMR
jgi:mitochondrial distribution and morphology protein 12